MGFMGGGEGAGAGAGAGGGGSGVWKAIRSLSDEVTAGGFGSYEINLFMIYKTKLFCKFLGEY